MAPRKTRNGASAAARRTGSSPGSGPAASSRTGSGRKKPAQRNSSPTQLRKHLGLSARLAEVIPLRPEFAAATRRDSAAGHTGKPKGGARPDRGSGGWWTVPVALALIIAVFGFAYYPVVRVQYREYRDRARLAAELKALQARNKRLDAEVARLRTPEGVEDYARTQLGLVKRGEHVVVVRDSEAAAKSADVGTPKIDSDRASDEPVGPWTGFLDLVFGVQ